MDKFKMIVGTLVGIHAKCATSGKDASLIEEALAVCLLIEEGTVSSSSVHRLQEVADLFFSASAHSSPDAPFLRGN